MSAPISYRRAKPQDMEAVHRLVRELADFEQASEAVHTDAIQFEKDGYGENPWFVCLVAEHVSAGVVGIALGYRAYSTWRGKMMYLDDLVVASAFRQQGIGKALLTRFISLAKSEGAKMVKWQVLEWNQPAIRLYELVGASFDGAWVDCKLFLDGGD